MLTPMAGYADWIGPAITPESPARAAPKAKTPVNTRSDVDAQPGGHLGVVHAGPDDRSQAGALDEEPEGTAITRPKAMTKSR